MFSQASHSTVVEYFFWEGKSLVPLQWNTDRNPIGSSHSQYESQDDSFTVGYPGTNPQNEITQQAFSWLRMLQKKSLRNWEK